MPAVMRHRKELLQQGLTYSIICITLCNYCQSLSQRWGHWNTVCVLCSVHACSASNTELESTAVICDWFEIACRHSSSCNIHAKPWTSDPCKSSVVVTKSVVHILETMCQVIEGIASIAMPAGITSLGCQSGAKLRPW